MGRDRSQVGVLWSTTAMVRSGRRTPPARQFQALEGLGRGHLVDQVQVDVNKGGLPRFFVNHVGIPDFLEHGLRGHI